jgi:glutathione S-transferase
MKLYHCAGSRGLRALWTLEEMELDYELVLMPFPPRSRMPGYLQINPLGTAPTLVDGDVTLTESAGIAHYLATRYGPTPLAVRPDEPDYGWFVDFLHHSDATLTFPQTVYIRFCMSEPQRGLGEAGSLYADWFIARLKKVEDRLRERSFLCADRFTVADIAIAYPLLLATRIGLADRLPARAIAWLELLMQREAFRRAATRETQGGEQSS